MYFRHAPDRCLKRKTYNYSMGQRICKYQCARCMRWEPGCMLPAYPHGDDSCLSLPCAHFIMSQDSDEDDDDYCLPCQEIIDDQLPSDHVPHTHFGRSSTHSTQEITTCGCKTGEPLITIRPRRARRRCPFICFRHRHYNYGRSTQCIKFAGHVNPCVCVWCIDPPLLTVWSSVRS